MDLKRLATEVLKSAFVGIAVAGFSIAIIAAKQTHDDVSYIERQPVFTERQKFIARANRLRELMRLFKQSCNLVVGATILHTRYDSDRVSWVGVFLFSLFTLDTATTALLSILDRINYYRLSHWPQDGKGS